MGNQYLPHINQILKKEIISAVELQSNFILRPEDEGLVYLPIDLNQLTNSKLQFCINNNGFITSTNVPENMIRGHFFVTIRIGTANIVLYRIYEDKIEIVSSCPFRRVFK